MVAAEGIDWDSDVSGGEWDGFTADDIEVSRNLERENPNLSDIEVSEVNSTDLSDFEANSSGDDADQPDQAVDGRGLLQAAGGGGRWSNRLYDIQKQAFTGRNPGAIRVLAADAVELDFFSEFFGQDLLEVHTNCNNKAFMAVFVFLVMTHH